MRGSSMALAGLAAIAFGWILIFVIPTTRFFAWIIIAIGIAIIAVAVVLDFRQMRTALASGRGRFGMGTGLAISLFIGVVLLANAISVSTHYRFDFTGLARFTLTSQTKQVLGKLDAPVDVITMFTPSVSTTVSGYARDLLAEYELNSSEITVKNVDPDLQPDEARRYGLDQRGAQIGVIIFQGPEGERRVYGSQISSEAEHAFTSAILEVTGQLQKRVYFVTGHGEADLSTEYHSVYDGLRDNLFSVAQVNLEIAGSVPPDTSALVIAGPRTEIPATEIAMINDYLKANGSVMVLVDPDPPQSVRDFAAGWWLQIDAGTIVDPDSYVAPFRTSPLVPNGRSAFQVGDTFFSGATAIIPDPSRPENVQTAPLAWTSDNAWLETDEAHLGDSGADARFDVGVDRPGPLSIAAVVAIPEKPVDDSTDASKIVATRLVVFGDSDFISERNFQNGGNSTLFLSAVNWLTASDDIISIDRKVLVTRRLLMNPEQTRFLHFSSIGLLPVLLLVAAGFVWWRRRQS